MVVLFLVALFFVAPGAAFWAEAFPGAAFRLGALFATGRAVFAGAVFGAAAFFASGAVPFVAAFFAAALFAVPFWAATEGLTCFRAGAFAAVFLLPVLGVIVCFLPTGFLGG